MRNPEADYIGCRRCPLHESRRHIVFRGTGKCSRGTVERNGNLLYYKGELQEGDEEGLLGPLRKAPLILFIGEAPGSAEDLTGMPFMGDAGRVFDLCLSYTRTDFRFHITNILACRPWTISDRGNIVNRPPKQTEIEQCLPRVKEILNSITYSGVIHLGAVARDNIQVENSLHLTHPSAIYRMEYKLYDIREFALKIDQYVNSLSEARHKNTDGG